MIGYKKSLRRVGLLILALALAGCQSFTGRPIEAEEIAPAAAAAEIVEEAETPLTEGTGETEAPSPPAGESLYQEGFTRHGDPFKGNPSAPVVIEEFSSYQCPFCGKYFRESYPQVLANYVETGRVLYVFRDFPLPSQPQSPVAAEAANCAGQASGASAYWAMHDRLLESQSAWSGKGNAKTIFKGYAEELRLDQAAFEACVDSGATRAQVDADVAEGRSRGVRSTPTFLINGQPLVGAQPYAAIANAIEMALSGDTPSTAETPTPPPMPTPAAIAHPDDALTVGDPDAPVTIVEFSDYQCPFCARHFQETWPELRAEFVDTGRVRYVFKDMPLTSIHPEAPKAHEAARCAGEQDAYWPMHDRLFAGQSEWGGNADHVVVFKGYAADLGLDAAAFGDCLDSGRWSDAVNADLAEGKSLGVRGTPTFFFNGYPLAGAQPYETFRRAIDLLEEGGLDDAGESQSPSPPAGGPVLTLAPLSALSPEIRELSPEVREAYRFALANPDVLNSIPCYCGCGSVGHLNNRECYIKEETADGQVVFDDHAAG